MIFLYDNLIDIATLTGSSAATGFSANNLKNPFRTKPWTTLGGTPGTANLVINHGSAKGVTGIALIDYTWGSAPGTLNFEANAIDSWGAPSVQQALTWKANPTVNGNMATIFQKITLATYQYNRLNVVYATGDWSLGRMFVGTYFEPTYNYDPQPTVDFIDDSVGTKTIGRQSHFDELPKYRRVSFSCTVVDQSQWELFMALINNVGKTKPLFISFDYANEPDEMTLYGYFTALPSAPGFAYSGYKLNFIFEEAR